MKKQSVWHKEDFRWALRKKPWRIPGMVCRRVRYSWQRITRGYSDYDVSEISGWFSDIIPDILQLYKDTRIGSPGSLGENYTNDKGLLCNDTCHAEWDKILDQMIFLFREMDEDTCSKKNLYEGEHTKICEEFQEKYGLLGENLIPGENDNNNGYTTGHFPDELPEYKEQEERYFEEERKIGEYRVKCKDRAFALFSEWFFNLWS